MAAISSFFFSSSFSPFYPHRFLRAFLPAFVCTWVFAAHRRIRTSGLIRCVSLLHCGPPSLPPSSDRDQARRTNSVCASFFLWLRAFTFTDFSEHTSWLFCLGERCETHFVGMPPIAVRRRVHGWAEGGGLRHPCRRAVGFPSRGVNKRSAPFQGTLLSRCCMMPGRPR